MITDNITHAIIYVTYNEKTYKSIKLDLEYQEHLELVEKIGDKGTNDMLVLKFPVTATKMVIFSKLQLQSVVIQVELLEKTKKTKKEELIKS